MRTTHDWSRGQRERERARNRRRSRPAIWKSSRPPNHESTTSAWTVPQWSAIS